MIVLEPISKRSLDNAGRAERVVVLSLSVRIRVRGDANSRPQRLPLVSAPPSPYFRASILSFLAGRFLDMEWAEVGRVAYKKVLRKIGV